MKIKINVCGKPGEARSDLTRRLLTVASAFARDGIHGSAFKLTGEPHVSKKRAGRDQIVFTVEPIDGEAPDGKVG